MPSHVAIIGASGLRPLWRPPRRASTTFAQRLAGDEYIETAAEDAAKLALAADLADATALETFEETTADNYASPIFRYPPRSARQAADGGRD